MLQIRLLLDLRVVGTPRPKGSLRFISKTYAKEQVKGSPDWRAAVVDASHRAIACDCDEAGCHALKPGYPYEGPVRVAISLAFVPPKKRQPLPASVRTGDVDKHARNILDALQDAGVVKNDAQVVDLWVSKRYTVDGVAGAGITVWAVAPAAAEKSGVGGRDKRSGGPQRSPSPGAGAQVMMP